MRHTNNFAKPLPDFDTRSFGISVYNIAVFAVFMLEDELNYGNYALFRVQISTQFYIVNS